MTTSSCATRREPEPWPLDDGCSLQTMWQEVRDATIAILQRTTFADLARSSSGVWTTNVALPVARITP